jgi:ABC-type oligopeptide transport system substrate-binding subunit
VLWSGVMSKSLLVFLLAVSLVVGLGSCFRKKNSVVTNQHALQVRWLTEELPDPTDLTRCHSEACRQHAALTLEGLTRLELGDVGVTALPALASEWKWLTPTTLSFTLRPGVRWSDGEPLSAQHFISAWQHLLKSGSSSAALLFPIRNARAISEGKTSVTLGVDSPNPQTLVLHLQSPHVNFPFVFSEPVTWPIPGFPATERTPGVPAIGPFILESRKIDRMVYRKNPHYYSPSTNIARIEIIREPLTSTRLHLFLGGEAEMADQIPRNMISQLEQGSGISTDLTSRLVALVFNTARRPFQSSMGRRAFEQAIDREELLRLERTPHFPSGTLLPVPPGSSAPSWVVPFNAMKAKELLATVIPESEGTPNRLVPRMGLQWTKGENLESVAENLQAQWAKNLEVKVDLGEVSSTAASIYLVKWRIDPTAVVGPLPYFVSDSPENLAHWRYRSFDSLMNSINGSSDLSKSRAWVSQAEAIVVGQESVVHPLYFVARSSLRQPRLKNVVWSPLEFWDFHQAAME